MATKNPALIKKQATRNVFTNRTTGTQTNRAGVALTPDQKITSNTGTSTTPVSSYENIGKANIQADYNANLDAELGLTGQQNGYSSMDQYTKDQFAALKEQTASQQKQLDFQKLQNGWQTGDQVNAIQGTQDVAAVGLASPREGATSNSNASVYNRLKTVTDTQIQRLQQSQDVANAAIEQNKTDLARAEKAGNTQLAAQYRQQIDSATSAAQQTETDLVNALSNQASTQSQITNNGIQTFQGLVEGGTSMDYNTVADYASQLGLPPDMLMGYYTGAQSIRDDKSLTVQDKQVALDQAKQDLNDQITGMNTQAAAAIRGLTTLRQSGASEDVIAAYKNAAGITDYNDPLTKAKLAFDQADAVIKQNEANGVITSPLDQIKYAQALYEYQQEAGISNGVIPEGGGSTETTAVQNGNGILFNFANNTQISSGTRVLTQCGQFVNDVLGLSMGDSYGSKMSYVDKNIKVPEAGMAFVMPVAGDYAPNGHTGIVESYDPSSGLVNVADVNSDGKGTAKHHQIPLATILDGGGFVPGSGQSLSGTVQNSQEATAVTDGLAALAGSVSSKFSYDAVSKSINNYLQSGDTEKAKNLILTTAANSLDATAAQDFHGSQLTQKLLTEIEPDLAALGGDTGFLSGTFEQSMQKIGNTTDPAKAAVQKKILYAMQRYRKGITGAGFAEAETAEYNKLFPGIGNSTDLNQATLDSLKESLGITVDSYYSQVLGQDVYNQLTGKQANEDLGSLYDQSSDITIQQGDLWNNL